MKHALPIVALILLAGCDRPAPPPAPPTPTSEEKDSVQLKLDAESGAVEFRKEEGGSGDDVDVNVKTE